MIRHILIPVALVLLFGGCESANTSRHKAPTVARVTFYDRHEDRFGNKIACSRKLRAKEGLTLAAPAPLPFFTPVQIPTLKGIVGSGAFVVQDRGSYLEKAFRRGQLRLDVYVASRAKLVWCKTHLPEFMEVSIEL